MSVPETHPAETAAAGRSDRPRYVFGFDIGQTSFGLCVGEFDGDGVLVSLPHLGVVLHNGNTEYGQHARSYKSLAGKNRRSRTRYSNLRDRRAPLADSPPPLVQCS